MCVLACNHANARTHICIEEYSVSGNSQTINTYTNTSKHTHYIYYVYYIHAHTVLQSFLFKGTLRQAPKGHRKEVKQDKCQRH